MFSMFGYTSHVLVRNGHKALGLVKNGHEKKQNYVLINILSSTYLFMDKHIKKSRTTFCDQLRIKSAHLPVYEFVLIFALVSE